MAHAKRKVNARLANANVEQKNITGTVENLAGLAIRKITLFREKNHIYTI